MFFSRSSKKWKILDKKLQIGLKSVPEKGWDADWVVPTLQGLSYITLLKLLKILVTCVIAL
jgi:hypothetical protein